MSKEAMKLALEALQEVYWSSRSAKHDEAITALRQALANEALDRMAENARELGLDYEPAQQADPEQPAQQEAQRWAVFCAGCRKEWSVPYQHPGKSVCAECEAKLKEKNA